MDNDWHYRIMELAADLALMKTDEHTRKVIKIILNKMLDFENRIAELEKECRVKLE